MHDTVWFELNGIPSVFVSTTAFLDTAIKQSMALGLPETNWVLLEHPYSFNSDEEVEAKALGAFDAIVAALTAYVPTTQHE